MLSGEVGGVCNYFLVLGRERVDGGWKGKRRGRGGREVMNV